MDLLPIEVHSQILSNLTLNEVVKCRLVNHRFKSSVECHLRSLTHLQVIDEWKNRIYKGVESLTQEKYLSTKPTQVNIKFTLNEGAKECIDPDLICFLGNFCPNFSVLEAEHLWSSFQDLLPVATSLRYFTLYKFLFDQSDLLDKFAKLECFNLKKETEDSYRASSTLVKKLLSEKRSILLVKNPSQDKEDNNDFEEIVSNGVRSLVYDGSPGQLCPVPRNLAKNLSELSLSFMPRIGFCEGPLHSLKYLKVDRKYDEDEFESGLFTNLFFTSPHLEYFSYKGKIATKLFVDLCCHLNSLAHLKIVDFTLRHINEEETIQLPLPRHLESFSLDAYRTFELTNSSSLALKSFKLRDMAKVEFDFPNLLELFIALGQNTQAPHLVNSLSKCTQLKSLTLQFGFYQFVQFSYSEIQKVIETIEQMTNLRKLSVTIQIDAEELPPLVVKHEKVSFLRRMDWDSNGRTHFYPNDVFESLVINSSIQFKASKRHTFIFRDQQLTTLYLTTGLTQLKKLQLECSVHNQKLLSEFDWDKFCELRKFEARIGRALSHVHVECLLEIVPKMTKLEKLTVLDWNCINEDRRNPVERETIVLKQENIPSVKNLYWDINGKLEFYPMDVFKGLAISKLFVVLENGGQSISYKFRKRKNIHIVMENKMQNMTNLVIHSIQLVDTQFVNQLKYLRKVKKLHFGNSSWHTSPLKMKMFRGFLRLYKMINSRTE